MIESKRTHLRYLTLNDLDSMYVMESNPQVIKFTPLEKPVTLIECKERLVSKLEAQKAMTPFGFWLAFEKESLDNIGLFLLVPKNNENFELGFMLPQSKWGKGFATECAGALVRWAFEKKKLKKISACTDKENLSSQNVLTKIGFTQISSEEANLGKTSDLNYYGITNTH